MQIYLIIAVGIRRKNDRIIFKVFNLKKTNKTNYTSLFQTVMFFMRQVRTILSYLTENIFKKPPSNYYYFKTLNV